MKFDFRNLFVFEIANNHQGQLSHGLAIVERMADIARAHNVRAAVKLQYRDLDTFIHPDWRARTDIKHVPRFLETRLTREEFAVLLAAVRENGMLTMVTPFDEPSVDVALDHGVDILKIASCSSMDWPLLEEIARARRPTVISTGGMAVREIDKSISFLEHRDVTDLAILHCVAVYPCRDDELNLGMINKLRERYPNATIGYSGHEAPDATEVVQAAVSLGAMVLERHVGLPTDSVHLNAYSMNPEQTSNWVEAALRARARLGMQGSEKPHSEAEQRSVRELQRGVFARVSVEPGARLDRSKVFFAMPCREGQTTAATWQETMVAASGYAAGEPVREQRSYDPISDVRTVVHDAKGMVREAGIALGKDFSVELSHHYGMASFRRFGAVIINFFNREYCKKLIIILPGQQHPNHLHRVKEETFQVLFGDLDLVLDGERKTLDPGCVQLVRRNQWHAFSSTKGCIFEEISTTHVVGDSLYEDEAIARIDPIARKTVIESW